MATVTNIATYRKPQGITHYAYLGEVYGTAEAAPCSPAVYSPPSS